MARVHWRLFAWWHNVDFNSIAIYHKDCEVLNNGTLPTRRMAKRKSRRRILR